MQNQNVQPIVNSEENFFTAIKKFKGMHFATAMVESLKDTISIKSSLDGKNKFNSAIIECVRLCEEKGDFGKIYGLALSCLQGLGEINPNAKSALSPSVLAGRVKEEFATVLRDYLTSKNEERENFQKQLEAAKKEKGELEEKLQTAEASYKVAEEKLKKNHGIENKNSDEEAKAVKKKLEKQLEAAATKREFLQEKLHRLEIQLKDTAGNLTNVTKRVNELQVIQDNSARNQVEAATLRKRLELFDQIFIPMHATNIFNFTKMTDDEVVAMASTIKQALANLTVSANSNNLYEALMQERYEQSKVGETRMQLYPAPEQKRVGWLPAPTASPAYSASEASTGSSATNSFFVPRVKRGRETMHDAEPATPSNNEPGKKEKTNRHFSSSERAMSPLALCGLMTSSKNGSNQVDSQQELQKKESEKIIGYMAMLLFGDESQTLNATYNLLQLRDSALSLKLEEMRNQQASKYGSEEEAISAASAELAQEHNLLGSAHTQPALKLGEEAKRWELAIHDVARRGNCFFDAILDQFNHRFPEILTGEKGTQQGLREAACFYVVTHWDRYGNFVEGNSNSFVERMISDGTWAEHVIIIALVECLNFTLVIIKSEGAPQVIKPEHANEQTPVLTIGYEVGLHYQSLRGVINRELANLIATAAPSVKSPAKTTSLASSGLR